MHSYAVDTAVFRLEFQLIELQGDGYYDEDGRPVIAGGGGGDDDEDGRPIIG